MSRPQKHASTESAVLNELKNTTSGYNKQNHSLRLNTAVQSQKEA